MSVAGAPPMVAYASVAAGAAAGALARWQVDEWLAAAGESAWATLAVNIAGSLLIGVLAGLVARRRLASLRLQLALMTGFCGGLTTFSAFGLEIMARVQAGQAGLALAYMAVSVPLWLAAAWAGYRLVTQGRWGAAR